MYEVTDAPLAVDREEGDALADAAGVAGCGRNGSDGTIGIGSGAALLDGPVAGAGVKGAALPAGVGVCGTRIKLLPLDGGVGGVADGDEGGVASGGSEGGADGGEGGVVTGVGFEPGNPTGSGVAGRPVLDGGAVEVGGVNEDGPPDLGGVNEDGPPDVGGVNEDGPGSVGGASGGGGGAGEAPGIRDAGLDESRPEPVRGKGLLVVEGEPGTAGAPGGRLGESPGEAAGRDGAEPGGVGPSGGIVGPDLPVLEPDNEAGAPEMPIGGRDGEDGVCGPVKLVGPVSRPDDCGGRADGGRGFAGSEGAPDAVALTGLIVEDGSFAAVGISFPSCSVLLSPPGLAVPVDGGGAAGFGLLSFSLPHSPAPWT